MKATIPLICVALMGFGCGQAPETKTETASQPAVTNPAPVAEKSVASQAIDGFTGKYAVDAGQRAKAKIRQVSEQKQKDLDQVMGQ